MNRLEEIDGKILAYVQGDLPLEKRPFDAWAARLGMNPKEFVERLNTLKERGVIREMKAVLRHRSAGFSSGAMVAWDVDEQEVEKTGREIARRQAVSHCYERPGFGRFRIFSMIHGRSDAEVREAVHEIASSLGIGQYQIFWSLRELKKSSMEYIREDPS